MIFGALQTLNEEAFEDVFEERCKESFNLDKVLGKVNDEIDVVYIQTSPLLPHTVVSYAPDCESATLSVESCYSPYRGSVSRASSLRGTSTNASPKLSIPEMEVETSAQTKNVCINGCKGVLVAKKDLKQIEPIIAHINRPQSKEFLLHDSVDPDHLNNQILQNEVADTLFHSKRATLSSLPDIFAFQNGSNPVSISDQISSSSFSSLERLKMLTKRLQKALVPSDDIDQIDTSDELESSPLVVVVPSPTINPSADGVDFASITDRSFVPEDQYIS